MTEPVAFDEEKLSGPQVLGGGRKRKSRGKKSRGRKSRGKKTRGGANHLVGAPITGGYKRRRSGKSTRRRRH